MINNIMQEMAASLGVKIILANQDAPEPQCPYASYTILRTDFAQPHQRVRLQNAAENDMVKVKHCYSSSIILELNFYNKGNTGGLLDVIMNYAQRSWIWLNEEGRDVCRKFNMVPMITSKEIKQEKESVKKDSKHRVGFEFALKGNREHELQIEAVKGVNYTGTILK